MDSPPQKLTGEEAVAVIMHTDLSKTQYMDIRENAETHNACIFPGYDTVLDAKKKCTPPSIAVTETCAEVPLQALVDHNACRLVEVLEHLDPALFDKFESAVELELEHKWGADGSSSHSEYQQSFQTAGSSDKSVMLTAIVPLLLRSSSTGEVIWTNPAPSSTTFCQPIRLQFKKETATTIKEEEAYILTQISNALPTQTASRSGKAICITHKFTLSMIDGKARAALTDKHTSNCTVCGATSSQMKHGHPQHEKVTVDNFKYGISVLHARIRFLEHTLHLSYKLHLKKHRANKDSYKKQKGEVQSRVKEMIGISVDVVKQGVGTTNSGNTSRRFFENPSLASAATGVDVEIIERYSNILCAISTCLPLNIDEAYCERTHVIYEAKYPWYPMPPSVHLILVHGADMQTVDLPMGAYSEEALEAINKFIRHFREHRTRKTSRVDNMHDLFIRLLLAGDIGLSHLRPKRNKISRSLPADVEKMLLQTV